MFSRNKCTRPSHDILIRISENYGGDNDDLHLAMYFSPNPIVRSLTADFARRFFAGTFFNVSDSKVSISKAGNVTGKVIIISLNISDQKNGDGG